MKIPTAAFEALKKFIASDAETQKAIRDIMDVIQDYRTDPTTKVMAERTLTTLLDIPTEVKQGFMCGVSMQHELGNKRVTIYPTVKKLIDDKKCTDKCGIVCVSVSIESWVKAQNLLGDYNENV